jgi:alpha-D-ribose 1-methylphosphonate 5-triphosphate synthase subunit PhnG
MVKPREKGCAVIDAKIKCRRKRSKILRVLVQGSRNTHGELKNGWQARMCSADVERLSPASELVMVRLQCGPTGKRIEVCASMF